MSDGGCAVVVARLGLGLLLTLAPSLAPAQGSLLLRRHYYWVDQASSLEVLKAQSDRIDVVSPQWFWVGEQGRIQGAVADGLVAVADEADLTVMPLVGNEGFRTDVARAVLLDAARRRELAGALVLTCLAYGFPGLQLDFEGLSPDLREPYARFVEELAGELHENDLVLSVALGAPLGARPSGTTDGADSGSWPASDHAASLDYARIGAAADWVTLMTYDQHTEPSTPGPVAGLPWVEACVRKTLEWVPADKLMLGVPLYFRSWSDGEVREGSHAEALGLAAREGATIAADATEEEKVFRFSRSGVDTVVWLQDAETLTARIELARRLGLAGFSAWRLGHEDSAAWQQGPLGRTRRAGSGR